MKVTITPSPLKGTVRAVASKSQAHRLLICAAFADGPTEIVCRELSKDIEATAGCLRALGCGIEYSGGVFRVRPGTAAAGAVSMDCGESGSTLRFLLPVLCALGVKARVKMHGRLPERPLSPLWEELERHGAVLSRPEPDVISVEGRAACGEYRIAANVSSQFISGLMFALPLTEGGGRIVLTGRTESAGYIEMTRRALEHFGVEADFAGGVIDVPERRFYRSPGTIEVEGDWSNAAFWITAGILSGGGVNCTGLDGSSAQGDRAAAALAEKIRAGGAVVDASDVPDLVPALSALAAGCRGETRFVNAGRLRLKESDRIQSTVAMLRALGADARETEDGLIVEGTGFLTGGTVDSAGDHRIAMSAAAASVACRGPVEILQAECVAKSYPAFWQDFVMLGGKIETEE